MSGSVLTLSSSFFSGALFLLSIIVFPLWDFSQGPEGLPFILITLSHLAFNLNNLRTVQSTHLKLFESELNATSNFTALSKIMDAIPGSVSIIDDADRFIFMNSFSESLYKKQLEGKAVGENQKGSDFQKFFEQFKASGKTSDVAELQSSMSAQSWFLVSINKINTTYGKYLVTAFPIDELVKLKQKVRSQELSDFETWKYSSLGWMASNLAHEINNPVSAILGSTAVVESSLKGGQFDRELMLKMNQIVRQTSLRIAALVESLKALSNPPSRQSSDFVNLTGVLNHVRSLTASKFMKEGIAFEVTGDFNVEVMGKENDLAQALFHIVKNSAEAVASVPMKEIRCSLTRDSEYVCLRVEDSSPDADAADIFPIMDPLYTTTKNTNFISGLGLSHARSLIINSGGTLTIEENSPTAFKIIFRRRSQD